MQQSPTQGPICQSCAMPLTRADDFGTAADGSRVDDYCRFCYQNGAFVGHYTGPQQMIDQCVQIMGQRNLMPEAQARAMLSEVIPQLKRWRAA
jgi:hypothetical protein